MKKLLSVLFVFVVACRIFAGTLSTSELKSLHSQFGATVSRSVWRTTNYKDSFGDELESSYSYCLGEGSYTSYGSMRPTSFRYVLAKDDEGLYFYLLSYYNGLNLMGSSLDEEVFISYKTDVSTVSIKGICDGTKVMFKDAQTISRFLDDLSFPNGVKLVITQPNSYWGERIFDLGVISR